MKPIFNRIVVLGVGLIGGSFGMAAKRNGIANEIVGIGRNSSKLNRAKELSAVDYWYTDIDEGLSDADLVYLATPVGNIIDFLETHSTLVKPGCIITDAGSTKEVICKTAKEHIPHNVYFIGGHPMAGSELSGVDAAAPNLFDNATYILTPDSGSNTEALMKMREMVNSIGANIIELDPAVHDIYVSVISHLPHVIAAALMQMAEEFSEENPQIYDLVSGSFRDMTRVAGSSPEVWRDICITNADNIAKASLVFKKHLDKGIEYIADCKSVMFEEWFSDSKSLKDKNIKKR